MPDAAPAGSTQTVTPAPYTGRFEYKWLAAGVVMVGALMSILNQTVVNVATPTFETVFKASLTDVQWIVTAYTLALAAVIPLTGWLSDRFGTKQVFLVSQAVFTVGSVLCGLAWSNESLIGFRVIQGLGGGLIMPVGMSILFRLSAPHERGRMMAMLGVPMMVGPVLGPTAGGWLLEYVDWRWIFFISAPIGVAAVILTAMILRPGTEHARRDRLDIGGLILVTPGITALVYGLSQAGHYGWESPAVTLPLALGVVLVAVFCLYELRQRVPLINLRLFANPAFTASMSLNFLIGLALFGAVFLLPLFLQQVQGYDALNSGIILAAQGIGAGAAMPIAGILTDRIGASRVVPFGLAVLIGASVWMSMLAVDTPAWMVALMMGLRGVGMAASMVPSLSAAYVTMPAAQIPMASSISNVVQRVAAGLGVAVLATVLTSRVQANLPHLPAGASVSGAGGLAAAHLPPAVKALLLTQVTKGFDETFWVTVGLALLGLPLTLLLRRAPAPAENSNPGQQAAGASAGRPASSEVSQLPPISTTRRATVAVLTVASLGAAAFCFAHGFRSEPVPHLPQTADVRAGAVFR